MPKQNEFCFCWCLNKAIVVIFTVKHFDFWTFFFQSGVKLLLMLCCTLKRLDMLGIKPKGKYHFEGLDQSIYTIREVVEKLKGEK